MYSGQTYIMPNGELIEILELLELGLVATDKGEMSVKEFDKFLLFIW